MTLIACSDGTCSHVDTVCGGPVAGTLTAGSNVFVQINGVTVVVDDGTLVVPSHNNPPCVPSNIQSHNFTLNSFAQSFVTVNGLKIAVDGDSYTGDITFIDNVGSNSFVQVS